MSPCSDRATSRRAACVCRRRRCRGVAANGVAGVKPGANSPGELVVVPRGRVRLRPAINVVSSSPTHEIYLIKPPLIMNAGTSARAPRPPRYGGGPRDPARRRARGTRRGPRPRPRSARRAGHHAAGGHNTPPRAPAPGCRRRVHRWAARAPSPGHPAGSRGAARRRVKTEEEDRLVVFLNEKRPAGPPVTT